MLCRRTTHPLNLWIASSQVGGPQQGASHLELTKPIRGGTVTVARVAGTAVSWAKTLVPDATGRSTSEVESGSENERESGAEAPAPAPEPVRVLSQTPDRLSLRYLAIKRRGPLARGIEGALLLLPGITVAVAN